MNSFTIHKTYNANWFKQLVWEWRLKGLDTVELPTEWQDLTADQLADAAEVLFGEKNEADAMAALFWKFTKLTKWQLILLPVDDIYCLMKPSLDFIKEPVLISESIIKQLPLKGTLGKHGPKKYMQGLCWKQFALAETLVNEFTSSKKMELLDSLCALLYCTPEHPTFNDWVKGMADAEQTRLEKGYAHLPLKVKQAVYLNYLGLKKHMIDSKLFEYLYPAPSKSSSESKGEADAIDWHAVTLSLAGGKFGTLDELYYTSAYDVIKHLDMQAKQK
jgi:hypothetical protein